MSDSKKFQKLVHRCEFVSSHSYHILAPHRRNGYIAIDEYNSCCEFLGAMFVGDFHECDVYTQGLVDGYYHGLCKL